MIRFYLNGKPTSTKADPSTPLLWVLRDDLKQTGTKYGCGIAQCGACTVHMDGAPIRSCSLPISAIAGRKVTTIEGVAELAAAPASTTPTAGSAKAASSVEGAVVSAWQELNVVQCGYCQSGQIMSAVALLKEKPKPTDADIDAAMSGNICRCATYQRVRTAIHRAASQMEVSRG